MCTLIVAARAFADIPLVIVANRDEQLDRASSPPHRWKEGFFAPRDDVAGGTWLGINDHGVFVGITNRYLAGRAGGRGDNATRASRGEIVVRALGFTSARAIHDAMRATDPTRYNGFHLVYADERDVLATFADGTTLAQVALGNGVHAITERSFGAGDDRARLHRIRTAWGRGDLEKMLVEHDDTDPLAATCVHYPPLNYGTRSAVVIERLDGEIGGKWKMRWAEGPPCVTPFRDTLVP